MKNKEGAFVKVPSIHRNDFRDREVSQLSFQSCRARTPLTAANAVGESIRGSACRQHVQVCTHKTLAWGGSSVLLPCEALLKKSCQGHQHLGASLSGCASLIAPATTDMEGKGVRAKRKCEPKNF
jgi:hypothetical protein